MPPKMAPREGFGGSMKQRADEDDVEGHLGGKVRSEGLGGKVRSEGLGGQAAARLWRQGATRRRGRRRGPPRRQGPQRWSGRPREGLGGKVRSEGYGGKAPHADEDDVEGHGLSPAPGASDPVRAASMTGAATTLHTHSHQPA